MWQFISSTGRHYGLEVGSLVDERRDPVRSSEAAARISQRSLRGVQRLVPRACRIQLGRRQRPPSDPPLGQPGFLDPSQVSSPRNQELRPGIHSVGDHSQRTRRPSVSPRPRNRAWNFDSVDVPDALDLQFMASKSGIPLDELRELNPAIRRDLTPAKSTTSLRLPVGTADAAKAVLDSNPRSDWAPRMIHVVRSGESLYTIARRYGSNVSAIRQANGLRSSLIHPGQSLIVPRFGNTGNQPPSRLSLQARKGCTWSRETTLFGTSRAAFRFRWRVCVRSTACPGTRSSGRANASTFPTARCPRRPESQRARSQTGSIRRSIRRHPV